MDFDSSSKFIASLAKFLQSLCNGYVDFDKGVEVIGHIYLNVDSDTGKKIDYVLNEKVCKNDNSVTFISHSFHAQPAEKPVPPKKEDEKPKDDDDTIVMDDPGQTIPSSTNVGTIGSFRAASSAHDPYFSPGSKRPSSPIQRRTSSIRGKLSTPQSPRFQDSGGSLKLSRNEISSSPKNKVGGDDFESDIFDERDQNSFQSLDQKPIMDPDLSLVKEEINPAQGSYGYSGSGHTSGNLKLFFQLTFYPLFHCSIFNL